MNKTVVNIETAVVEELKSLNTEFLTIGRRSTKIALRAGELLTPIRAQFPERGPKAAGWGKFLKSVDIPQNTAWMWMNLWARREKFSSSVDEISLMEAYAVAGLVRAKEEPKPAAKEKRSQKQDESKQPQGQTEQNGEKNRLADPAYSGETVLGFPLRETLQALVQRYGAEAVVSELDAIVGNREIVTPVKSRKRSVEAEPAALAA